jgi:Kef-type K+ transport system membrane component KefB/Trk K+ transport system NAD-binding subunit
MTTFLQEFGFLFIIVIALAFLVKLLKQPIIIGYVLSGACFAFFFAKEELMGEQLMLLSTLGITFLLFLMGLEFDLKGLKFLGKDIIYAVSMQSLIFFSSAFLLSLFFPFTMLERVYLSVIFMICSTLLVAKWVDDKKETQTLHGRLILGTLIFQDIIAILAITLLAIAGEGSPIAMAKIPLGLILMLVFGWLLSRYLLTPALRFASKHPELLFGLGLAICFIFVELALRLKLPETIGAFMAGVILANTIYKADVASRLKPLITFFTILFFVGLGFQLDFTLEPQVLLFSGLLVVLSFVVKPIITYLTLRLRGYDPKTSFLVGVDTSALSEFGIIVVAGAVASGIVGEWVLSVAIMSSIASMIVVSYLNKYDKKLWKICEPFVLKFDRMLSHKNVDAQPSILVANAVFFGYYQFGKDIVETLTKQGKSIVVIENDPANMEILKAEGVNHIFSTVNDPEFFEMTKFAYVEVVVSNSKDVDENIIILTTLKKEHPHALFIMTSKSVKDAVILYDAGADYVIYPTYVNEQQISILLQDYATDLTKLLERKSKEVSKFKEIKEASKSDFFDVDFFFDSMHKDGPDTFIFNLFNKKKK